MSKVKSKGKKRESHDDVHCLHVSVILHLFFVVYTIEHSYVHKDVNRSEYRTVEDNVAIDEHHHDKNYSGVIAAYELT